MITFQGDEQVNRVCVLSELPICKGINIGKKMKKVIVTKSKPCFPVGVLRQLNDSRTQLEELWANRKMKLDLCLQLRLFERDALEVNCVYCCIMILIDLEFLRFGTES